MFAPENHYSWITLREDSEDWATGILLAGLSNVQKTNIENISAPSVKHSLFQALVAEGFCYGNGEASFVHGLLSTWLIANFLERYNTLACSPAGLTMRASSLMTLHADRMDWFPWPWPKFSEGEFHGYFQQFRLGKFSVSDVNARFIGLDFETGTVTFKNNTKLLYKYAAHHNDSDYEVERLVEKYLIPFKGWAICWNPDELPETNLDVLEEMGFGHLDLEDAPNQFVASESNSETVYMFIREAFPDGKGDATWSEVERKVGYSRRHIVRTLKIKGVYDDWSKGGQTS